MGWDGTARGGERERGEPHGPCQTRKGRALGSTLSKGVLSG